MKPAAKNNAWLLVCFAACVIPLGFAFYTSHVWEDYYITFRCSRNLVDGHGLVYQPGERVHAYTSPLGVLLPAVAHVLSGGASDLASLWVYRLMCAGAFAGAAAFLWRIARNANLQAPSSWVLVALVVLDPKTVDFTANGMETALLLFFLAWVLAELTSPDGPRYRHLATAYAGMMWTRPDAFILAGAASFAALLFRPVQAERADQGRLSQVKLLSRSVGFALVLYAPWFLCAWWYYGSPIPHTIVAKSAHPWVEGWWERLPFVPLTHLAGASRMNGLFMPSYFYVGGWWPPLEHGMTVLSVLASYVWVWPRLVWPGRMASFALFLGSFYLSVAPTFPWYFPPWTMLGWIALTCLAGQLGNALFPTRRVLVLGAATGLAVLQLLVLLCTAVQLRTQQRIVEEGVRKHIGLWLKQNSRPGDTVFAEPIGYIGYYSGLKLYDWPGLTSREVVRTIQSGTRAWPAIVSTLKPTWVVLRPTEYANHGFKQDAAFREYELMGTWDASQDVDKVSFLPGRAYLHSDDRFLVFIRKDAK